MVLVRVCVCTAGYKVSNQMLAAAIFRYADSRGNISLDNFLILMAKLMKLFSEYGTLMTVVLTDLGSHLICACTHACIHPHMHTPTHAYTHTCIHPHMHTPTHACTHPPTHLPTQLSIIVKHNVLACMYFDCFVSHGNVLSSPSFSLFCQVMHRHIFGGAKSRLCKLTFNNNIDIV